MDEQLGYIYRRQKYTYSSYLKVMFLSAE